MALELTKSQREEFWLALIAAFSESSKFCRFVETSTPIENLEAEVGKGSLNTIIWDTLKLAEADGWLEQLFTAAVARKGKNPKLAAFAKSIGRGTVSGAHEYLNVASFDLTDQEAVWRKAFAAQLNPRLIIFLMREVEQEVLEPLIDRLGRHLAPESVHPAARVTLKATIASLQEAIERVGRLTPVLATKHALCAVHAETAQLEVMNHFFAGVRQKYPGALNRYLVLIVNASPEWPCAADCVELPVPIFEEWHLNDWIMKVTSRPDWSPGIRAELKTWIQVVATYNGALTGGGVYDALGRAIEFLRGNPDESMLRNWLRSGI
jgi:hypothetical protein